MSPWYLVGIGTRAPACAVSFVQRVACKVRRRPMDSLSYLIYGLPLLVLLVWHVLRRRRLERKSEEIRAHTGSAEPASLHPIINPARCIGCGSCVKACPEQEHHA